MELSFKTYTWNDQEVNIILQEKPKNIDILCWQIDFKIVSIKHLDILTLGLLVSTLEADP